MTFTDSVSINPTTLNSNNLTITGPGGFMLPVTLAGTTGTGPSVTATYQITPPNADWTTVPYGTYVISLASAQVKDLSGNLTLGGAAGDVFGERQP